VINPLDVKENDEDALDFALHLSHLFSLSKSGLSMYGSCTYLITARTPSHFFQDLHKI
jgi:hypothetical protein